MLLTQLLLDKMFDEKKLQGSSKALAFHVSCVPLLSVLDEEELDWKKVFGLPLLC